MPIREFTLRRYFVQCENCSAAAEVQPSPESAVALAAKMGFAIQPGGPNDIRALCPSCKDRHRLLELANHE